MNNATVLGCDEMYLFQIVAYNANITPEAIGQDWACAIQLIPQSTQCKPVHVNLRTQ